LGGESKTARSGTEATLKHGIGFWMVVAMLLGLPAGGACAQEQPEATTSSAELQAYKLVGTVEGDANALGAVFEDPKTKKQKLYRIGDVVDGATIVEIKNQQVLLRRGAQTEVVHITGGSPVQRQPGDSIQVVAASDDPRENLQGVLSQVIPPYDRRVAHLRTSLSRGKFDRFVEHFNSATGQSPKFVDTVAGPALSVADLDQDVLKDLRLERADLIVGISGMGIESQERLAQILETVSRAKVVDISVLRGGAVQPLYYVVH
jgi:general secretion pathway protein C